MTMNLAASIRARLKQHADSTRQDFNLTLTHYGLALVRQKRSSGHGGELFYYSEIEIIYQNFCMR